MTTLPLSVGVDLVEIPRIRRALERWGDRFLQRVYTPAEIARCRGRVPELAVRFAAKEAVVKAYGTGFTQGMTFHDIVVSHDAAGKPLLLLSGRALELQHEMGIGEKFISISDEQEYAVAFVTLLKVV